MSLEDIKIEPVTEKDRPWIIEFFSRNFFLDEPLTRNLKVYENPFSLEELEKFTTKSLYHNLSFAAKDSAGNLLGVCINSVRTDDEYEEVADPTFGKITKLLDYGSEGADVLEKFPDIDKVFFVEILSVDRLAAGKGIGTLLVERAR
ncbi:putative N-acetyltransferase [Trypoxylus dichotomus]